MNYKEKETRIVNFVLAPSNRYVGWVIYNNAYYFGSANTLGRLIHNVNLSLYRIHKITLKLRLASKPTDKQWVPVNKMTEHFKSGSYFNHKLTGMLTEEQAIIHERSKPQTFEEHAEAAGVSFPLLKHEYVCEEKDGEMIVYELREFARYKLHNNKGE